MPGLIPAVLHLLHFSNLRLLPSSRLCNCCLCAVKELTWYICLSTPWNMVFKWKTLYILARSHFLSHFPYLGWGRYLYIKHVLIFASVVIWIKSLNDSGNTPIYIETEGEKGRLGAIAIHSIPESFFEDQTKAVASQWILALPSLLS